MKSLHLSRRRRHVQRMEDREEDDVQYKIGTYDEECLRGLVCG